ncbi:MAG: hypothetical protein AAGJ52_01705 [Pseudomonadota bacterium]
MIPAAEALDTLRRRQVDTIVDHTQRLLEQLQVRLPGDLQMNYRRGYPSEMELAAALQDQRDSDRDRGFTQRGPHRADLALRVNQQAAAVELSRGQQKLLALALLLAQLAILEAGAERPPVLLLDDPVSELDRRHLGTVLDWLQDQAFQTWITATQAPAIPCRMFHVEQGRIEAQELA